MLSIGDGIAIASIAVPAGIGLIIAYIRWGHSSKSNNPGNNSSIPNRCPAHSGIVANIENLQSDMTEVKNDVKIISNKQDQLLFQSGEIKLIIDKWEERRRND